MPVAQRFKSFEDLAVALGRPPRTPRSVQRFFALTPVVKYGRGAFRLVLRNDPCAYCGGPGGTVDHIDAQSVGGQNRIENLTGACKCCNSTKGSRSLLDFLLAGAAA